MNHQHIFNLHWFSEATKVPRSGIKIGFITFWTLSLPILLLGLYLSTLWTTVFYFLQIPVTCDQPFRFWYRCLNTLQLLKWKLTLYLRWTQNRKPPNHQTYTLDVIKQILNQPFFCWGFATQVFTLVVFYIWTLVGRNCKKLLLVSVSCNVERHWLTARAAGFYPSRLSSLSSDL